MGLDRPTALRIICSNHHRLSCGLPQTCLEAHAAQPFHKPIRGPAAVGVVFRVCCDGGKPQKLEEAGKTLRELLIYLRENCAGMNQDFTRWPKGLNRVHSLTAQALAARVWP